MKIEIRLSSERVLLLAFDGEQTLEDSLFIEGSYISYSPRFDSFYFWKSGGAGCHHCVCVIPENAQWVEL
ncbi:MAG: hypothetical protein M0Z52_03975 [Actinomycetota bacterium]|nr:hypothetical protein [Actinomycetota bacterium]